MPLHVSSTVLIIRRSKLHYTASDIIIPIGVMIPDTEINILRCTVSKTSKNVHCIITQSFVISIIYYYCS